MKAIHSYSTKPFFLKNVDKEEFDMEDFEILTMILSALYWRKYNGKIKMYTDFKGMDFIQKNFLRNIWDGGIDVATFETSERNIDRKTFWAAGKIEALEAEKGPVAQIDLDFIILKNLDEYFLNNKVVHAYEENLEIFQYLPKDRLVFPDNYFHNPKWTWKENPFNTSIMYFSDEETKRSYTFEAFRFMENNLTKNENDIDGNKQMMFAEQQILAMICQAKSIKSKGLINFEKLKTEKQNVFIHLGETKSMLKNNKDAIYIYCKNCVETIKKEFPEFLDNVHLIPKIQKFL